MDTPVMWLKNIVPDLPFPEYDTDEAGKDILEYEGLDKAVDEFADRITLSGSHVERVALLKYEIAAYRRKAFKSCYRSGYGSCFSS